MNDEQFMHRAIAAGDSVRGTTAPNPWVGCVVVSGHRPGADLRGGDRPSRRPARRDHCAWPGPATCTPGGRPCSPPLSRAPTMGGRRPVPTPSSRRGWPGWSSPSRTPTRRWRAGEWSRLRAAGIEVSGRVRRQPRSPSSWPRTSSTAPPGSPWVVLKMAASLDARTAAPDGTSRWITGARGPPRRPPPAGPLRCDPGGGRARYGPTIPS